jgi:hypothetical protein
MIFGRPPKGYNDIENQFYQIRLELDNALVILKNNIESFNLKHDAENEEIEKLQNQFNELTDKYYKEQLSQGEESHTAHSIAESEASDDLRIDPYSFNYLYENLFTLQRDSLDGYYKASIVLMYSQIESFFIKLCQILKDEIKSPLALKDLAGHGYIAICLTYLNKVVGIEINEKLKDRFLNYQRIRNNIIHDNSSLIEIEGKPIKPILSLFEGAYTEDDNRYYINDISIVEQFKKDTENFLESLEAEIEKRIGFKTILKRMRTGLGNQLFDRNNETVKVDGDKFIYSCIINRYKIKDEKQKLTITIQKVSKARKILDEENSTFKIATKEEFLEVFDATSKRIVEIFKHYKSLINGKRSYSYTMVVEVI